MDNFFLNPIDVVEEVIYSKKWTFSRADDYELVADISSNLCQYRLYFTWSENVRAMSFSITFDLKFPQSKLFQAYELIGLINEKLWIGHFDITSKNGIPAFRHTILSSNDNDFHHKKLEDLVDIAVYECEKYYQSFQQVLFDEIDPSKSLVFASFETVGSA